MYKTLQEALGLGKLDLNEFRKSLPGKGELIAGYNIDYLNWVIDGVTISYPVSHDPQSVKSEIGLGRLSECFWHFRRTSETNPNLDFSNDGFSRASPLLGQNEVGPEFPLRVLNPDVMGLPLSVPKDDFTVQTSFVAANIKLIANTCRHKPFDMVFDSASNKAGENQLIRLRAEVQIRGIIMTPHLVSKQALIFRVNTPFGDLDVSYALKDTNELDEIRNIVQRRGSWSILEATGWLLADCATGHRQLGAQYNLPHILRLTAIAIKTRKIDFLTSLIADDTVLTVEGRIEAKGTQEIFKWFEAYTSRQATEPKSNSFTGDFDYVLKLQENGTVIHGIRLNNERPDLGLMLTAKIAANKHLSEICLTYESLETLKVLDSFSMWERGNTYDAENIHRVSEKDLKEEWDYIKNNGCRGDFWLVAKGERSFDVFMKFLPKDLGCHGMTAKIFSGAEEIGTLGEHTLYETKDKLGFYIQFSETANGDSFDGIVRAPSMFGCGCPEKFEILATSKYDKFFQCRYYPEFGGCIALNLLKECAPLVFWVPDLTLHQVFPGSQVELELYGIAQQFRILPKESFSVEKRKLLRDVFEKITKKRLEDFPGIDFDPTRAMNTLASKDNSVLAHCQSVIQSVKEMDFYGVPLLSFKVSLQRDPEKEIFAYVYANRNTVKNEVKPGDVFIGDICLMARIHNESKVFWSSLLPNYRLFE